MTGKKIVISVLFSSLVFFASVSKAQAAYWHNWNQCDFPQTDRVGMICERTVNRLDRAVQRYEQRKDNYLQRYEKRKTKILDRLEDRGCDTTQLREDLVQVDQKVEDIANDADSLAEKWEANRSNIDCNDLCASQSLINELRENISSLAGKVRDLGMQIRELIRAHTSLLRLNRNKAC